MTKGSDRKRWQDGIARHLNDFPRQFLALEYAMSLFGTDFDLPQFKAAYNATDPATYHDVQALERAAGRVQNYVAALAEDGVRLADLDLIPVPAGGSRAQGAFEALREEKVVTPTLCKKLIRAQRARSRIERSYVTVPAGDVHRAILLVHEAAKDFVVLYRDWIESFLSIDS